MDSQLARREPLGNEQVELIKATIAKGATDSELKLFIYQCERTGLDPLSKQIYSIKRAGKMVTQIGIDGARLVAARSGRYAGQDGPYWCGEDGQWSDVWLPFGTPPRAARVSVYLMGVERGTPGVAHWDEYAQLYNGQPTEMWKKMPALMLAKCAEMLALRKAFPQELSGLYSAEEMAQDGNVVDTTYTLTPPPEPTQTPVERTVDTTTGEITGGKVISDMEKDVDLWKTNADKPPVATNVLSETQFKRLHTLGVSLYGKEEWEERRPRLAQAASKGVVTSSKDLSPQEAAILIAGIERKIAELAAMQVVA